MRAKPSRTPGRWRPRSGAPPSRSHGVASRVLAAPSSASSSFRFRRPRLFAATGQRPARRRLPRGRGRKAQGLLEHLDLDVVDPSVTDTLGDTLLADHVARDEPEFVGLSLYLWNTERSLHLAREVKRRSPRTTHPRSEAPRSGPTTRSCSARTGSTSRSAARPRRSSARIIRRLVARRETSLGHPGVAVRTAAAASRRSGRPLRPDSRSPRTPRPTSLGLLPVDPARATYVETVRGCRSHCTFCFYPRSSSVLRALSPGDSARPDPRSPAARRRRGRVPRPDLQPPSRVPGLPRGDPRRQRGQAAPVLRGDPRRGPDRATTPTCSRRRASRSSRSASSRSTRRPSRGRSAAAAPPRSPPRRRCSTRAAIRLLVDLIIGLPGDTAADVARGVDFLLEHGLGDEAQVFPLAVLPGTAMRADAARDGLVFDPVPALPDPADGDDGRGPRSGARSSTPRTVSGRRLDETPRPHLVSRDGLPDAAGPVRDRPRPRRRRTTSSGRRGPGPSTSRSGFAGGTSSARGTGSPTAVEARIRVDPHARLDVVLAAAQRLPARRRRSRCTRSSRRAAVVPLALAGDARRGRPARA